MTFYEDWEYRYLNGTATLNHLERLVKIGKLTEDEFRQIVLKKHKVMKGMYNVRKC